MDDVLYRDHAAMETDHWWFQGRRAVVTAVLDRHLGAAHRPRSALDVGCGTGGMLPVLARFASEVVGLDMSAEAVGHAQATAPPRVTVRVGSIPEHVPSDGSLDLVSAFDVVEHIDDDVAALVALRQALKPDMGMLIITVPAYQWLWSPHDDINRHKRRYTRRVLRERLVEAGFDVVHLSYFNSWLLPVVSAVRMVRKALPKAGDGASDFVMPRPAVNGSLTRLFASERHVVSRVGLPAGVSLVALCRVRATAH
jgi:2-polyprenyl-3-methyl-5-hydroxy-6-metoxy-1,4-benzoquinol methylase